MEKKYEIYLRFLRTFVFSFLLLFFLLNIWSNKTPRNDYQLPSVKPQVINTVSPDEQININVYEKASPAVVNITSTTLAVDYFYNIIPQSGAGSGFVFDSQEGLILTNHHVVKNARYLEVALGEKEKIQATLIGSDPDNDLAILQLKRIPKNLNAIPLGENTPLQIGQKVLAIGNPFGLGRTLTTGVISALNRSLRTTNNTIMSGIIQTDAAINPGNSGGPLLDSNGVAIGINTAIFTPSGGNVGIGFAIPIMQIRSLIPDMVRYGKSRKAWLGVQMQTLYPELAKILELTQPRGALITSVIKNSPAAAANMQGATSRMRFGNSLLDAGGDVILSINDVTIDSANDVINTIAQQRPGDSITIGVLRNNKREKIKVILGGI